MTAYSKKWLMFAIIFLAIPQITAAASDRQLSQGTFSVDQELTQSSINAKLTEEMLKQAADAGSKIKPEEVFSRIINNKLSDRVYHVLENTKIVLNEDGSSITMKTDGSDRNEGRWTQKGRNIIISQEEGHFVGTIISDSTITFIIGDIIVYFTRQQTNP
ncbi:MAG: hypothetical protein ABIK92_07005 [Pseudomonadota bacterium]